MGPSAESGLPAEVDRLRRYAAYLKDSPIGNRCLDCAHVRHNELGYCQIGQCSCEYHNSIEGLGRLIERELTALLTRVLPPASGRDPVAEFITAERALHGDGCLYPEDDCTCVTSPDVSNPAPAPLTTNETREDT